MRVWDEGRDAFEQVQSVEVGPHFDPGGISRPAESPAEPEAVLDANVEPGEYRACEATEALFAVGSRRGPGGGIPPSGPSPMLSCGAIVRRADKEEVGR